MKQNSQTLLMIIRSTQRIIKIVKKFQTIIIKRQNKSNHNYCLTINNVEIKSKKSVTLLGIEIDDILKIEKQVSTVCKKVNNQLNAIVE